MSDYLENVDIRQLEAFRAIAKAGTFHGAASDMGFSQSVMSQHLAALEKNVGLRLIDRGRGKRKIELTQAGEILLKHVYSIEASLGAASADLSLLRDGAAGTIRIGTYQSVSSRILPRLLQEFTKKFPAVNLEVREGYDDKDLLPLLETGELDFVFTGYPIAPGPFEAIEVLRDPWVMLTQSDSGLATKRVPLPVSALKDVPLIGFASASVAQRQLEDFLSGSGLQPNIIFRTNDNVAVIELVATGFGSAIMPALTVNNIDKRILRLPIAIPSRSIALAWHAKRTRLPASDSLISIVQQICDDIAKKYLD